MTVRANIGAVAIAMLGAALATGPAHADCKAIGAVGTGVTQDIAKFMATAALKNIRESQGYGPSSTPTFKCESGIISTDCHARQKVCK